MQARKPNLLFLMADDHAGYAMGCDGSPVALTPNLDRLASEGMRFAKHYCNSPVCTASRQSLLTGQLPHAAGVTRLATALSTDKPTVAKQLRQAGYHTAVFGKMHFNRSASPGLHGFDTIETEAEIRKRWQAEVRPEPMLPGVETQPPWRPFKDPARVWLNARKLPVAGTEEETRGAFIARRATAYMEQNREKPFALWVSFHEPHSPFDFPVDFRGRFDPQRMQLPRIGPEDASQIPLIFRSLTETERQGISAAYYTSAYFLDRNIGKVLNALRRLNLEEDTLVVYTADHGYCLGHHGRFEKHCGYDPALRVPLLIRWPGRLSKGVVWQQTEHVDVAPTILDLLNADPLPVRHGASLRPVLQGRKTMQRAFSFFEYLENEEAMVQTARHKLIFCSGNRKRTDGYETENPTPGRYRRLYDTHEDPAEFTDRSAQMPAVADRLESLMLERFRATHPEASAEPQRLSRAEALEWYLRPRDV